jgi:UDP-GlcNAc:undecaprenyl-phosphate GlcNAc-1-phosphate transferase
VHKIIAHPVDRSSHDNPIATGGGLIFAGLYIIFALLSTIGIADNDTKTAIFKLCIGSVLIILVGIIDDKYYLRARYKLIGQIVVAFIMVLLGFKITNITNPFGAPFTADLLSMPITILWYLLIMNAINLIDGLDGLASGIALISCAVLLVFSLHHKNFLVFINCFFLIIPLFVFLLNNFMPAKLFMGDTGSLFIGFILASLAIAGNEAQFKGITTFTLLVPVTVIFIPLSDTFFTIFRRLKNKQPIFKADKNHFHHKLVNLGLSQKAVTLICWFVTFIFGVISLGYIFIPKIIMLLILFVISMLLIGLFFYIYKKELFK